MGSYVAPSQVLHTCIYFHPFLLILAGGARFELALPVVTPARFQFRHPPVTGIRPARFKTISVASDDSLAAYTQLRSNPYPVRSLPDQSPCRGRRWPLLLIL